MVMTDNGRVGARPRLVRIDSVSEDVKRHHAAIVGMERRLSEQEGDVGVARMVLAMHYAAFAVGVAQSMGGDVRVMKNLTDRNNIIPLAGPGAP